MNTAKMKASKQKIAERARARKRAKKEEELRALLKTEEEVAKMKSEQKEADWVKEMENAREIMLAAGYTQQSLDHSITLLRAEFINNPLGISMNDA